HWSRPSRPPKQAEPIPPEVDVPMASPGMPLVWPGQFVLGAGYPKQRLFEPATPAEPSKDLPALHPLLENGSFLVWPRLRQYVDRFWAAAAEHRNALSGSLRRAISLEDAAALFVGRHRDGTPLIFRPVLGEQPAWPPQNGQLPEEALNHFAYRTPTPAA